MTSSAKKLRNAGLAGLLALALIAIPLSFAPAASAGGVCVDEQTGEQCAGTYTNNGQTCVGAYHLNVTGDPDGHSGVCANTTIAQPIVKLPSGGGL